MSLYIRDKESLYVDSIHIQSIDLLSRIDKVRKMHYQYFPFIISLIGVVTDYVTTRVGLNLGFYETHQKYNPALALMIFWGALGILWLTLPRERIWSISKIILSVFSFLGTVNNTLVIFGVFSGLII